MLRFTLHTFSFSLLCGLAMAALPQTLAAQASLGCNYQSAAVRVDLAYEPVAYEFYKPMLDIYKIANLPEQENKTHAENWPVGLETGILFFEVNTDILRIRPDTHSPTCGQIKSVQVQVGFRDNHIYVAKEFPRRSCPFNTVLAHEEQHAEVDRKLLEDFEPRISAYFANAAREVGIIRSSTPEDVQRQITDMINSKIDVISQEIQTERRTRQQAVDTQAEYKRVSDSCDGQLQQIVNDRLALLKETYPDLRAKPPLGAAASSSTIVR